MKKLAILFLFTLVSCSTVSNYTKNTLNTDFFKNKTIVFTLNSNSKEQLNYEGPRAGYARPPNAKEVYRESIEELAKETKLNLKFEETEREILSSEIHIDAEITGMKWIFTLSSATMKTDVNYVSKKENKLFKITGSYRNMSGGSEKNNLRKSFKNANYLLLKEIEK
ncbi:hypothetical protein [Flavobacterium sp. ZB4P13]|uniref:hypothetical protein n=1 Tax=Flavobacterium sp. ZB4P13 TaxID=3401728 RepID=UPI003AACBF9B